MYFKSFSLTVKFVVWEQDKIFATESIPDSYIEDSVLNSTYLLHLEQFMAAGI